eukprot:4954544-Pleurochrysis_carterae.AAC.1
MQASMGTGPADGSICHSRHCTAGVLVSGSSTAASAARRPASPVSVFSATSLVVAAAGRATPTSDDRAALRSPEPTGVSVAGMPRRDTASSTDMRGLLASAQLRGDASVPHKATAPPVPRTSLSQSFAATCTAGWESGASRCNASPLPAMEITPR